MWLAEWDKRQVRPSVWSTVDLKLQGNVLKPSKDFHHAFLQIIFTDQ